MSHLFEIYGNLVTPKPEILLIPCFGKIWERDKSKEKSLAKAEFAYMEFMMSMYKTNPFREYPENKKRNKIIESQPALPGDWKPDIFVIEGMDYIDYVQTEGSLSWRYWKSNVNILEKQIEYFNEIDLDERNLKTGVPIYKPSDIPNAVEKAEKVLIVINNLKSKVEEELYGSQKNKGGKEISPFAKT